MILPIDVGEREMISLVGGGGKTSLLRILGDFLSPRSVVLTTSTHIENPSLWGDRCYFNLSDAALRQLLDGAEKKVFHAHERAGGKVRGFDPIQIDAQYAALTTASFVVEADGAKGYPFKIHNDYEPAIPKSTSSLIAVVGADAFFKKAHEAVFRIDKCQSILKIDREAPIPLEIICRALQSESGYLRGAPPRSLCRRILLINKAELLQPEFLAEVVDSFQKMIYCFDYLWVASLAKGKMYYYGVFKENV